jgi:hypothetical protein
VKAPKKRVAAHRAAPQAAATRTRKSAPPASAPREASLAKQPRLERTRRILPETERLNPSRDLGADRMMAAARTGHDELRANLKRHTETSPAMTAGDLDAKWEDAYAVGDEAPGGDNPTPDQDRVDDIGRALGVEYQDNQELQGGDEIVERDHKRWELDPASSEDWPHKE